jgi:hypothetical protein
MISIMLLVEFLTVILVPLLCVVDRSQGCSVLLFLRSLATEFRLWLDAARSFLLFASHFGIAVWFACKTPSMICVAGRECLASD